MMKKGKDREFPDLIVWLAFRLWSGTAERPCL